MKNFQSERQVLVVGGQSRGVGKTSLVVDLIGAFPQAAWHAVKITQHEHGVSLDGESGGRAAGERNFTLDEEADGGNRTDSSRFLAAGAARAFWLRAKPDGLAEAMPLLLQALAGARNVIFESNAVLQFLRPTLYVVVLDPSRKDFKESARLVVDRADALVLRKPFEPEGWAGVPVQLLKKKPSFLQGLGDRFPDALAEFVRQRYFGSDLAP